MLVAVAQMSAAVAQMLAASLQHIYLHSVYTPRDKKKTVEIDVVPASYDLKKFEENFNRLHDAIPDGIHHRRRRRSLPDLGPNLIVYLVRIGSRDSKKVHRA